ncbi:MAG: dTDP-4-dehydrorhamnose reductase [Candidatus Hydrogenedentes bacterium]|nr:dTDP-4-dehydrorhamnose reductase [Candidatus Hydrogenedentota bacterium]
MVRNKVIRVLILGAKGQLGRDLMAEFGGDGVVTGLDLPELDIAEPSQVSAACAESRPELVINAAAYTDVEGAEDHAEDAFRVNEVGAGIVAQAAAELGIPVVYYSTDFVFRGDATRPYEPEDTVSPRGLYAKSKAMGEIATAERNAQHYIIRTAWLYGPGGRNFVEKILRTAATRPSFRVVTDEIGSPTHTFDLAEATWTLAGTGAYGTYHAVNAGACSRFEMAQKILAIAGITTPVEPCLAEEFPSKAPRPHYSVLSNAKLEKATGQRMRPWEQALEHYMERRKTI